MVSSEVTVIIFREQRRMNIKQVFILGTYRLKFINEIFRHKIYESIKVKVLSVATQKM